MGVACHGCLKGHGERVCDYGGCWWGYKEEAADTEKIISILGAAGSKVTKRHAAGLEAAGTTTCPCTHNLHCNEPLAHPP